MSRSEWILCERKAGWAAALRHAVSHEYDIHMLRIYEVRNLDDLAARLEARPQSFVLIEVTQANLPAVLDWLADAAPQHPTARFAALVDEDLKQQKRTNYVQPLEDWQEIIDALAEAGASAFARSPRQLRGIFVCARQHAKLLATHAFRPETLSIDDWAVSQLPWQDT